MQILIIASASFLYLVTYNMDHRYQSGIEDGEKQSNQNLSFTATLSQTAHRILGSALRSINFQIPVKMDSISRFLQTSHTQIS